jgi:hypothetical protein
MSHAAHGDDRPWSFRRSGQKRRAKRRTKQQGAPPDSDGRLPEVRELTREEWAELLDEEAQRYFGVSGEEFRRRYEAGEYDVEAPHVWEVALMLPAVER